MITTITSTISSTVPITPKPSAATIKASPPSVSSLDWRYPGPRTAKPPLFAWIGLQVRLFDDPVHHVGGHVLFFPFLLFRGLSTLPAGRLPGRPVTRDERPKRQGRDVRHAADPTRGDRDRDHE